MFNSGRHYIKFSQGRRVAGATNKFTLYHLLKFTRANIDNSYTYFQFFTHLSYHTASLLDSNIKKSILVIFFKKEIILILIFLFKQ